MALTRDDYLTQLRALLPEGAAWPREQDSVLSQLLLAWADEMARLDVRVDNLIDEADPTTCNELLSEWETNFGLPDPCTSLATTLAERRAILHARVTANQALTPQFFIDLAATFGYTVTVAEPWEVGIDEFTWRINAPSTTVRYFRAGQSRAGDRLRTWGDELLECVLQRHKPAHTDLLIAYG